MPVVFLERLPLPSLRMYTSISVVLLACAIYYASQIDHYNYNTYHGHDDDDSKNNKENNFSLNKKSEQEQLLFPQNTNLKEDMSVSETNSEESDGIVIVDDYKSESSQILSDNIEMIATNETISLSDSLLVHEMKVKSHTIEHLLDDKSNTHGDADMIDDGQEDSLKDPRDYVADRENIDSESPYMLRLVYSLLSEGWCIWVSVFIDGHAMKWYLIIVYFAFIVV